jgi:hypothetical protein
MKSDYFRFIVDNLPPAKNPSYIIGLRLALEE